MKTGAFYGADILLPKAEIAKENFSVIACDQYTSQPDYWHRVEERVGDAPSAVHLIFPEVYLNPPWNTEMDFNGRVESINRHMTEYLEQELFDTLSDTVIYLERTLRNGTIRKGLVGKIDLEQYDFSPEKKNYIRATEGTVKERLPVRVQIRKNAPMEFPHVMLLADDPDCALIEPLTAKKAQLEQVYDFDLMEDSGHLSGWKLPQEEMERIFAWSAERAEPKASEERYGVWEETPMVFAVGDGNHSLATAKTCYEKIKAEIGEEAAKEHPSRWALVELVNLYDASLQFEGIHRVIFSPRDTLLEEMKEALGLVLVAEEMTGSLIFSWTADGKTERYRITKPTHSLAVGCVQKFLDEYLKTADSTIDYVHGADEVYALCAERNGVGMLFDAISKDNFFEAIVKDGVLPRKTFSMGEACDKRFYLEGRKIR